MNGAPARGRRGVNRRAALLSVAGIYQFWATMADESGDGGSSMATLLRDKLVGSDLEPLHVELTE